MIKVLHVMNDLRASGMERMFVSAAPYFVREGVTSHIVAQGDDHPFQDALEIAGYRIHRIGKINRLRGARQFRRLVRSLRPDIVHIHSEGAYATAVALTRSLGSTPIVRTIHNIFTPDGLAHIRRRWEVRIADKAVQAQIAVSSDVATSELAVYGRVTDVILNWVDDRYQSLRSTRASVEAGQVPSIVIVGNSSSIKNHLVVLQAISDLNLQLYFHGSERDASPAEVSVLDALSQRGLLQHRGTDQPDLSLIAADAFVMPSLREGMGISLAEALVVGVPSLVSDVPGFQWAIDLGAVSKTELNGDWVGAISSLLATGRMKPSVDIDLSATRGSREYSSLYRALLARLAQEKRNRSPLQ